MASPLTRSPSKSLLQRILLLRSASATSAALGSLSAASRSLSTSTQPRSQKLERISDELLSLNKLELYDCSILFRIRLGLNNSAPALSGLTPSGAEAGQQAAAGADAKPAEKTVFDVKLDNFDAAAKIKVIKVVRGFTELGLKRGEGFGGEGTSCSEKGVSKEEGESIIEKLKARIYTHT